MELNGDGFFDELLALRRDSWEEVIPTGTNEFFLNNWAYDSSVLPTASFGVVSAPFSQSLDCSFTEIYNNPEFSAPPFSAQEENSFSIVEEEEPSQLRDELHDLYMQSSCKVESVQSTEIPDFDPGFSLERRNRVKKVEGQPSKNLMAERRRRKRLNDRLLMLRSVVPKISKMDRTSILGDTIDYMKELLERINNLQEEIEAGSYQLNLSRIFKDLNSNDFFVRNSPKFDVERGEEETRIEICCAGKPGLLLSTVTTLEALGLEIQQCVTSCFSDFAMQASCSGASGHREITSSEDIKQALFRNAGYGGRCL